MVAVTPPQPLSEIVHPTWATALEPVADQVRAMALAGVDASWLPAAEKKTLRADFERDIAALDSEFALVCRVFGWAFAIWGAGMYWWAGLLYAYQVQRLLATTERRPLVSGG